MTDDLHPEALSAAEAALRGPRTMADPDRGERANCPHCGDYLDCAICGERIMGSAPPDRGEIVERAALAMPVTLAMPRETAEAVVSAVGYAASVVEVTAERQVMGPRIMEHAGMLRWLQSRLNAALGPATDQEREGK